LPLGPKVVLAGERPEKDQNLKARHGRKEKKEEARKRANRVHKRVRGVSRWPDKFVTLELPNRSARGDRNTKQGIAPVASAKIGIHMGDRPKKGKDSGTRTLMERGKWEQPKEKAESVARGNKRAIDAVKERGEVTLKFVTLRQSRNAKVKSRIGPTTGDSNTEGCRFERTGGDRDQPIPQHNRGGGLGPR